MRKIFSLVIGACFLVNSVSFALCPPLISGNLADNTHEDKFLIMAEAGLQNYLKSVDTFTDIADSRNERFVKKAFKRHQRFTSNEVFSAENTIFNPAIINIGSTEVSQVGENSPIFMVPVLVEKNGQREDYRLLFSTIKDHHNGYPTALCTLKEFNKIENAVKSRRVLPQRDAESAKKLAKIKSRYLVQNENTIDVFLRNLIEKRQFTEFKDRAQNVLGWDENTYPGRRTPEKYLAEAHSDCIRSKLGDFLSHVGTDFDATFTGKNIVLIRVPDGTNFPVIWEGEKNLKVTSHTSEHAVYVLLKEKDYDLLSEENNIDKKITDIMEDIVKEMVHEAGVIYRSPWILARTEDNNSWRFSNGLDTLYDWRKMFTNGETHGMAKMMYAQILETVKSTIAKGPTNLDHLVAGGVDREYAAAETDKKIAGQIEELIIDASKICEITDEFIKQQEWVPILGAKTYGLLAASKAALPHTFNYAHIHVKAFALIIKKLSLKATIKRSRLTTEIIDLDYIQCFFETLFRECACELTSAQYFDTSLPNNWETWFTNPPEYADALLQITVKSKNEKNNGYPKEFIINVAAGGNTKSDNKKIYIEANPNERLDRPSQTLNIDIDTRDIEKDGSLKF